MWKSKRTIVAEREAAIWEGKSFEEISGLCDTRSFPLCYCTVLGSRWYQVEVVLCERSGSCIDLDVQVFGAGLSAFCWNWRSLSFLARLSPESHWLRRPERSRRGHSKTVIHRLRSA